MPTVTPANYISLILDSFASLIAESATLQTYTGLTQQEILDRMIWFDTKPPDGEQTLSDLRPFIIIQEMETSWGDGTQGFGTELYVRGVLGMVIEENASPEARDAQRPTALMLREEKIRFSNLVGGIIEDMVALNDKDGRFGFHETQMETPTVRVPTTDANEDNDYWTSTYLFEYGHAAGGGG